MKGPYTFKMSKPEYLRHRAIRRNNAFLVVYFVTVFILMVTL